MRATFNTTNITTVPIIPYGVENLYGTFASCKNLVNASVEIPSSVTNMYGCFLNCSLLIEPPLLNNGIENLENTFENCEELQKTPIIPESVTNIRGTFSGCKNLSGILIINGNISGEIYGEGQTKYAWCLKNAVTVEGKTLKISGNWKLLKDKSIIRTTFGIDDNNSERIILYE